MIGMMIAMAYAMCAGLIGGLIASTVLNINLMASSVIGIIIGISIGALFGKLYHWVALLDGFLSGIMGGMMGAMTGEMLHPFYYDSMIKLMLIFHIVTFLIIMCILKEEMNISFSPLIRFMIFHPIGVLVIFLLFFVSTEMAGPIVKDHDSNINHHFPTSTNYP